MMQFYLFILLLVSVCQGWAFAPNHEASAKISSVSKTYLSASRGMGMATKPKNGKKKAKNASSSSGTSNFDVSASVLRNEKKYEKLQIKAAKLLQEEYESMSDPVMTEYIVATRAKASGVKDWVPIAFLCLVRSHEDAHKSEGSSDPMVQAAVSYYCRELAHVATMGSRIFKSIPRTEFEYAVETSDSFHRHVYENVVEGKHTKGNDSTAMTKAEARKVLNLGEDVTDLAEIRKIYRKMSFVSHPDRHVGKNMSEVERQDASDDYHRVKLAYETLCSGIRETGSSWYESLGGRARTDFCSRIELSSITEAKEIIESTTVLDSAVAGLDPELVQTFVTRAQATV